MRNDALRSLSEQQRLLRMEYEAEKASFCKITEALGLERLAERGNAWVGIRLERTYYNSLNQRVVELYRNSDGDDDHNFEYGKPVAFFAVDCRAGSRPRFPFTGTVSYVDGDRMVVAVPDNCDLSAIRDAAVAGVMLSFDETSYRTMFEALETVAKAKGRLGELRDLFYSPTRAGELSMPDIGFPYLNESQCKAVNKVLRAKDVAIVHGPPGTGKTTTLVEAINETLRRESQVLVCAQSNMAVDWICEKLVDRGIHVLRLGNPSRVNDKMLSFTYERRFESHPDYPDLWAVRKAMRELKGSRRNSDQWHQKMDRLRSRATELELRINNDLFNNAHVIASTLVGSASRLLDGMKFPTLFIDEAAQALEAASWIPMRRAGRVILAGDHCQLPPTVKCYEAMKQGLGVSLMERLAETHPEAVTRLSVQYRMNEAIMEFPNRWFYGGSMIAAPEVRFRGILDLDTPIDWLDTSFLASKSGDESETVDEDDDSAFRESLAGAGHGRVNRDEALFAVLALQRFILRIGRERFIQERIDVGLISPYRAQVRYLRSILKKLPFFKPFRRLISVDTVDGFQGQERDVIVISLVRSNDDGNIGFLRDLRRMNVAMTRARMKLIIVGNVRTMASNPFYRKLNSYVAGIRVGDSEGQ